MAKKIKKVNKRRVAERRPFAKRAVKKKTVKRRTIKKPVLKKGERNIMGVITHYFPKVSAGVIKLKKTLKIGDTIKIKGHTDRKSVV